jgi:hypothetical protein
MASQKKTSGTRTWEEIRLDFAVLDEYRDVGGIRQIWYETRLAELNQELATLAPTK